MQTNEFKSFQIVNKAGTALFWYVSDWILFDAGKSAIGETLLPSMEHPKTPLQTPREKLQYLGTCMDILVEFTDFPKVCMLIIHAIHFAWNLKFISFPLFAYTKS